ncbi:uncharacterized protein TNIN_395101 [Trichonephila inaurata madagascariensis]|uniref:C2H2-type domain-containing protein n=1 Tax=Trichonephila inaurata madagascariensis TaxID=2747483 RepID=A0A8X6YW58_9ARAC|nr:uncharacterized protein TNIN_395101 [Trichonephila inaurata madagascariensis]
MEHERPINAFVCPFCKGSFDRLENLNKHVQQIHSVRSSTKENRLCPLCGTRCLKIEGYRNHLRHIHGLNEEGQVVSFRCFNDFLVWKNELEKRNYCKYVMQTPPKKLASNDKLHIYHCDSSVRSMKEKKSGVAVKETCPAVISAIESSKTRNIKIEHWNNHVGHSIPIEEVELDTAIGSLGSTEIIITTDHRFSDGQNTEENIFYLSESNDGSYSESFAKETPKKITSMFQSSKSNFSENTSRPAAQRFSYKKDPTKKSGSFNYSLASVACMKSSTKKKTATTPAASTTSTKVVETTSNETTNDSISTPSTQVESNSEKAKNDDIEWSSDCEAAIRTENNDSTPLTPTSTNDSNISSKTISGNQTYSMFSEGAVHGQVVLLNSLPGQNDDQKVILCTGDQKILATALPIEQIGNESLQKTAKDNLTTQAIVLQIASEKENTSVQDLLNISQNSSSEDAVKTASPIGPSSFKRKSLQKPTKKNVPSSRKKIAILGKKKEKNHPEKVLSPNITNSKQKLNSPTGNSVPKIQGIITIDSSSPNVINSAKLISTDPNIPVSKIQGIITINSASQSVINSVQLTSNAPNTPVTEMKSVATSSSTSTKDLVTSSSNPSINSANQVLLNSFPSGQAYMSINNNLIPIGPSTAPLLQPGLNPVSPGFMLTSPVAPSPFMRPVRPLINFSPFAPRPPLTPTTQSQTSDANISNNQNVAGKIPPGTVPVLLIPHGSQISSTPVGGVTVPFSSHSNVKSSVSTSVGPNSAQPIVSIPRPLTTSGINPVLNSHLLPGTHLISSAFLPNNAQFMSAPLLTSTGQRIHGPYLQNAQSLPPPLIGQPGVAPVRSIISTTVSNAIKVQKVQLPFTRTVKNPALLSKNNVTTSNVSEKTKVSNVLLNTEPISSTPAISVPSVSTTPPQKPATALFESTPLQKPGTLLLESTSPQKPGTLIFESSGDVYMLEPIEDSVHVHLNTSVLGAGNRVILPAPPGYKRDNTDMKSNSEKEVELSHEDFPSLQLEKAIIGGREIKIDGKLKSPRRNKEVKNGVQIKSVLQEKRPLKDDDVEILKKVKYYQMEMKYLASQAECKRLRLELAKAQRKNRDPEIHNNTEVNSSDLQTKQDYDVGVLHIDLDVDKQEQDEASNFDESQTMDVDVSDETENAKVSESQTEDINRKTKNTQEKIDETSNDVDSESQINKSSNLDLPLNDTASNSENMENQSCDFEQDEEKSAENQTIDNLENQSNDCVDNRTGDIEPEAEKCVGVDKSSVYTAININECLDELEKFDNKLTSIYETKEDEETNELNNKILENFDVIKQDNKMIKSSNKFKDKELNAKKILKDNELNKESVGTIAVNKSLVMNDSFCHQQVLNDQDLINHINENLQLKGNILDAVPLDTIHIQGTLKKLETQYGKDKPLDVYTMIRTSVLRSLYDDMKTVCGENKKLFDELQKFRSRDKICEIDSNKAS